MQLHRLLRKALVVYKEEDQENRIGSGERYAGDDINGLGHTYRMRRLLLPDLHEARLQRGGREGRSGCTMRKVWADRDGNGINGNHIELKDW